MYSTLFMCLEAFDFPEPVAELVAVGSLDDVRAGAGAGAGASEGGDGGALSGMLKAEGGLLRSVLT